MGGGLINYGSVEVSFVVAKVVTIYFKLGFLIFFVHKLAKAQTYIFIFQSYLCKHVLLT